MVEIGKPAPDFSLTDQNGKTHKLSDYKGKPVVLYFYPKDDTAGCTKEACSIRDGFAKFKKADVEVFGVSTDDEKSHQAFIEKYKLPFTLLADKDKEVVNKYGVWVEKTNYGKKYWGTARKTFLIGKDGKISYIFDKVDVEKHADEILEKLPG